MTKNNFKKMVALFLVAAICLEAVAPCAVVAKDNTLYISTPEDLVQLSKNCRYDEWSINKKIILLNDISLKEVDFEAIPYFAGTFDGQGYTISDFEIDGSVSPAGFFRKTAKSAQISNLTIMGSVIPTGNKDNVGGIVGENSGIIKNCSFSGVVSGGNSVGGIVGKNQVSGSIADSTLLGLVFGDVATGGIAGKNLGSILGCTNKGNINNTSDQKIITLDQIETNLLLNMYSFNNSDVITTKTDTGGIAGYSSGIIGECMNRKEIGYPKVGYNVGGIVGRSSGYIYGCNNYGDVLGRKDIGGIVGQAEPYTIIDVSGTKMVLLEKQISVLEQQINSAVSHLEGMKCDLKNSMNQMSSYISDIRNYLKEMDTLAEEEELKASEDIDSFRTTMQALKDTLSLLEDALDNLEQNLDELNKTLDSVFEKENEEVKKIESYISSIKAIIPDIKTNIEHIKQLEEKHDIQAYIENVVNLLNDSMTLMEKALESLDIVIKITSETLAVLNTTIAGLQKCKLEMEEHINNLKQIFDNLNDENTLSDRTFLKIESILNDVLITLANIEKLLDSFDSSIQKISMTNGSALKNSIESIRVLILFVRNDIAQVKKAEKDADIPTYVESLKNYLTNIISSLEAILTNTEEILNLTEENLKYLEEAAQTLKQQKNGIESSLDEIKGYLKDINNYLSGINVEGSLDNLQNFQQSTNNIMDGIMASMDEIYMETTNIDQNLSMRDDALMNELSNIKNQLSLIENTIKEIPDGIEETLEGAINKETTIEDIASLTYGKIMESVNYAQIEGNLNIGGIAGNMSLENKTNPEEELLTSISWREQKAYELKTVLYKCINKGMVITNKDTAGAICGQMSIGLISTCYAYGTISSESGDYVGGIVGLARAKIRDCVAKCVLSGENYVGGIIGSGYKADDGTSSVENCYSMVKIADSKQYKGAIAGAEEGTFHANYFVSEELQGINDISYKSMAQPITYNELLQIPNLPDELKTFTLSFIAEDKVIKSITFNYGERFDETIFPEVPEKEGYDGVWDITDLSNLCFDTIVHAEYTAYITSMKSDIVRDNGRPVFLIEGNFSNEDVLTAKTEEITKELLEELGIKVLVKEYWKVTFPNDGQKRHNIRFLPKEDLQNAKLFVRETDKWIKVKTEEFGSYKAFQVAGNDVELLIVPICYEVISYLIFALLIIVSIIGFICLERKKHIVLKICKKIIRILGWKKLKLLILILSISIIASIIGYSALLPQMRINAELLTITADVISTKNHSMKLSMTADIGSNHIELQPQIYVINEDKKPVLVLKENEHAFYLTDEVIFLENGKGYRFVKADKSRVSLLEQIRELYKATKIEKTTSPDKTIYSITTMGEDAKGLVGILVSSFAEGQISSAGDTSVKLIAKDGILQSIKLEGRARLNDAMETEIVVSAIITDICQLDDGKYELPQNIAKAMTEVEKESFTIIDEELYRLLLAFGQFKNEEKEGFVKIDVSCGAINIETEHDWEDIAKGLSVDSNASNLEKLPNMMYEICMNCDFSSKKSGNSYIYQINADSDTMNQLAEIIAPELKFKIVNFSNGEIEVAIEDNEIKAFNIQLKGTVNVLFSEVDASVESQFIFN